MYREDRHTMDSSVWYHQNGASKASFLLPFWSRYLQRQTGMFPYGASVGHPPVRFMFNIMISFVGKARDDSRSSTTAVLGLGGNPNFGPLPPSVYYRPPFSFVGFFFRVLILIVFTQSVGYMTGGLF